MGNLARSSWLRRLLLPAIMVGVLGLGMVAGEHDAAARGRAVRVHVAPRLGIRHGWGPGYWAYPPAPVYAPGWYGAGWGHPYRGHRGGWGRGVVFRGGGRHFGGHRR